MITPRRPNKHEMQDILAYMARMTNETNMTEVAKHLDGAIVGVADKYITDGPGYAGKVVFIVWPAGPETHEVLYYYDGKLRSTTEDAKTESL